MKQGTWRRGRVYYTPSRRLSRDDVLLLEEQRGAALLSFVRHGGGIPTLRVMLPPGPDAASRKVQRWERAQANRVSPPEFVELLGEWQLSVFEDTNAYFHVTDEPGSLNAQGRELARLGGVPLPSRRKGWSRGGDHWRVGRR